MDAAECERKNRLHPEAKPIQPYIRKVLESEKDSVFVAATDYVKAVPLSIAAWIPGSYTVLGTDGYGRSDTREALRRFFEVDAASIVIASLHELYRTGAVESGKVKEAIKKFDVNPEKACPMS
jgi:pyruvate dehydrogenase E1 component